MTQEIERQTGRTVDFSTVHTTLKRLEEKGFLLSAMGGATAERRAEKRVVAVAQLLLLVFLFVEYL